jgi:hypothetical protein
VEVGALRMNCPSSANWGKTLMVGGRKSTGATIQQTAVATIMTMGNAPPMFETLYVMTRYSSVTAGT